ncbi:hypothetical protein GGR55DRAFT_639670 [Xylaria sp. FL0064]|nr:hypothetical protein GGR55DRAFT_639670 [Xylaria sp. FL0064]
MAASDDPRVKFGLSCPIHGQFYICQDSSTRFIGCCGVDPCTPDLDGQCPTTELFNASFSAASGVMFLPQSCTSPYDSSIWYTCDYSQPPFLGCCTNNPCNNGCLEGHLVLATLSEDPKNSSQLMLPETTTTATPISTATPSATGTSELPGGTESPGLNTVSNGRVRAGMIAGISVAGVVILLLVIAVYLWKKRREDDRQRCEQEETIRSNDLFQAPPVEKTKFLALFRTGFPGIVQPLYRVLRHPRISIVPIFQFYQSLRETTEWMWRYVRI